ncbi:MAG: replication-associated recombination protein A [Candidatus Caenarcaniphilales bacterium]|nr:replication-associated recombination protein A [Candidatus Caenarcaniphilales bacterium]
MANKDHPLLNELFRNEEKAPLAERMRPKNINDFLGHEAIFGHAKPLSKLIQNKELFSFIFWGPPGCGKTTLARILAKEFDANFIELSAVSSGLKELRAAIDEAKTLRKTQGIETILFIDEIHRYNKAQQDAILKDLEDGSIKLIGATTENPSFQVIPAVLSRLIVIRLEPLSEESICELLEKAIKALDSPEVSTEAKKRILKYANGDVRSALNLLELAYKCSKDSNNKIDEELISELVQQNRINYDKDGDSHYDLASAYQKSLRGSDTNAALYWLGKMIAGGEDPRFIARRLLVTAAEDVGLADPMAFVLASSVYNAAYNLGWPEARIPLAEGTIYVAKAPKSNLTVCAIDAVLEDITKNGKNYPVPEHLRDSHYKDAKKYGHGVGYLYSHDHPDEEQCFLPEELKNRNYLE